jgi:hypothetical protein
VDALTVLANGKVGIGTASPLTTLTVNDLNPVVSLKNKRLGSTEYQIRNGVLSPTSFDIFDKTYNTSRFAINGDGNVAIGATPINEARFFVMGNQSNGANFDLRSANQYSTSTIEVQADDYETSFQAAYIQYIGSGIPGELIPGVPRADAGTIAFQGAANGLIYTITHAPLILATDNTERMRITADGLIGVGTRTPQAAFDISSKSSGFLPPRMTTQEINSVTSPVEGLMIYNTDTHKLNVFTGSVWETVLSQ